MVFENSKCHKFGIGYVDRLNDALYRYHLLNNMYSILLANYISGSAENEQGGRWWS